jgi:hypothetical protein
MLLFCFEKALETTEKWQFLLKRNAKIQNISRITKFPKIRQFKNYKHFKRAGISNNFKADNSRQPT